MENGDKSGFFFLSYASSDEALAKTLAERLEAAGLEVWCAAVPGTIPPGSPFVQRINSALEEAAGCVVLITGIELSKWVTAELSAATKRQVEDPGFTLVPLLLDGVEPDDLPPLVKRLQVIRATRKQLDSEAELHREIATLLRDRAPGAAAPPPGAPFPGLRHFDEEDSSYFFGRSREVESLCRTIGRTGAGHVRWLQVEGPTGVGKSSLVRAGLLPAVRRGWLRDTMSDWTIATMRPGVRPVLNLATALLRSVTPTTKLENLRDRLRGDPRSLGAFLRESLGKHSAFLLVLDQLEELFVLPPESGAEAPEVLTFTSLIEDAVRDPDLPFYLVSTIRADFLTHFSRTPMLGELLNDHGRRYYLNPLSAGALGSVIESPCRLAGVKIQPGLVVTVVQDTAQVSSGLPLAAHTLHEMWSNRSGEGLTHRTYHSVGGVAGSLTRSADAVIGSIPRQSRNAVRRLLIHLVRVGREGALSRKRLDRNEALRMLGRGTAAEKLLFRLTGGRDPDAPPGSPPLARLVSISRGSQVELVHDILLQRWPRLQNWVEKDRTLLARTDELETAALHWDHAGRAPGGLPSGRQLEYYREAVAVSALAEEFLRVAANRDRRLRIGAERFHRLHAITDRLLAESDLPSLLEFIMDSAVELTGAERGFLIVVDGRRIAFQVARNFNRKDVIDPELEISKGVVKLVIRTGEPLLTDNATEDERFSRFVSVDDLSLSSILSVPLVQRGVAIGAVYLDNRAKRGVFTEFDLETLQFFTDQAAIAIQNLRRAGALESEIEEKDSELERVRKILADQPLRYDYPEIIGRSRCMKEVLLCLDHLIDREDPVLILGEPGTGKELIARAIHSRSSRKERGFSVVSASADPELSNLGALGTANGGTLLIRESEALSPDGQSALLRILQGEAATPGDGEDPGASDLRVVCAAGEELEQLRRAGSFPVDLHDLLGRNQVRVPPLKERREDIALLAREFVRRAADELGVAPKLVSQGAAALLLEYDWPENVRELEAEMLKAVALPGNEIVAEDLSPHVQGRREVQEPSVSAQRETLRETMEATERAMIERALEEAGGNQTLAAENLGISRVWLRKKLQKYGIVT